MSDSRRKELLSKAVTPPSFSVVGTLTAPRTYGVYQLKGQAKSGRTFRFGNHPVRPIKRARLAFFKIARFQLAVPSKKA